jgi:hypothetical protein
MSLLSSDLAIRSEEQFRAEREFACAVNVFKNTQHYRTNSQHRALAAVKDKP